MKNQPLISIIIPVYNVERYLAQCLDSVINQTYRNLEIICVNDGTRDSSGQILEQYAQKDGRIVVIVQENQGLSGARNTGLKHVHGKYIMFVDSDDWIELETCEEAVIAAEKHNADLVMWSYVREFEHESKEKYMFWDDESVFETEKVKNQLHRRVCGLLGEELRHPEYSNAIETAWGKLYLAEKIIGNKVGFVDTKEIGTEDALFNLYALGYIKRAVYLRRCLNHYRKTNQGSLTKNYNEKLFERWQRLFDYMRQYIQENNLPAEYDMALDNRIALSLLGLGLNIVGADRSIMWKLKEISGILKQARYREAYNNLDFQYFPIHWKLFYWFARMRFSLGVFVLLSVIHAIISR